MNTVAILTPAFFIVSIRVNLIIYVHDSNKYIKLRGTAMLSDNKLSTQDIELLKMVILNSALVVLLNNLKDK